MPHKAFKAHRSDDGFISIVGFNGDSLTTKSEQSVREFAAYLIDKYHEEYHDETQRKESERASRFRAATAESIAAVQAGQLAERAAPAFTDRGPPGQCHSHDHSLHRRRGHGAVSGFWRANVATVSNRSESASSTRNF